MGREFLFLPEDEIEDAAACIRTRALGNKGDLSYPLDLQALVFDYLYDDQGVGFRDDVDLGRQDGDKVLGKTLPRREMINVDITLKREGPLGRYRFTVAHEIGHWVLHRNLFLKDASQGELFGQEDEEPGELISLHRDVFPAAGRSLPSEEWQANRFAIALLLDGERLREEFRARFERPFLAAEEIKGDPSPPTRRELSRQAAVRSAENLPPLTEVFGLSREATAIALEERGYVRGPAPAV